MSTINILILLEQKCSMIVLIDKAMAYETSLTGNK